MAFRSMSAQQLEQQRPVVVIPTTDPAVKRRSKSEIVRELTMRSLFDPVRCAAYYGWYTGDLRARVATHNSRTGVRVGMWERRRGYFEWLGGVYFIRKLLQQRLSGQLAADLAVRCIRGGMSGESSINRE